MSNVLDELLDRGYIKQFARKGENNFLYRI